MSCDRVAGVTENGNDLWYSGKGHRFADNVQFVAAPDGAPLWVSDVEPGSFHDLRTARTHALPALYKAVCDVLSALADVSYTEASAGVHTPFRPHADIPGPLHVDNRAHNKLLRGVRVQANEQPRNLNSAGVPCRT